MAAAGKRGRLNKKVRDYMLTMPGSDEGIKKGRYYKEEELRQDTENSIRFVPNGTDPYEFTRLSRCRQFDTLLENSDGMEQITCFRRNIRCFFDDEESPVPLPIQSVAMPYVLKAEYDVMIRGDMGWGKTFAYAIPIIYDIIKVKSGTTALKANRELYALIVVPTSALCQQIYSDIAALSKGTGVTVFLSHVGFEMKDTERRRKDEGINILICEDKHLVHYFLEPDDLTQVNTNKWNLANLRYLVLEEAHQLVGGSEAVYNDEGQYEKTSFYQYIQPLAYTLEFTFSNVDYHMIMVSAFDNTFFYHKMPYRPNGCLYIEFEKKEGAGHCIERHFVDMSKKSPEERLRELCRFVGDLYQNKNNAPRMWIFVNKPDTAGHVCVGVGSTPVVGSEYCGYVTGHEAPENQREMIESFKNKTISILVSTDAIAPGLNIPDVDIVVNFNLPKTKTDLDTRIGRCVRLGHIGAVISYFDSDTDAVIAGDLVLEAEKSPSFIVPKFIEEFSRKNAWCKFVVND